MTLMFRRFRLRRPGPALALCALALFVAATCPPAAASAPAGVPFAWGYNGVGQLGNGRFIDTGVASGTRYFYVVTAVNAQRRESANSNQASAKP